MNIGQVWYRHSLRGPTSYLWVSRCKKKREGHKLFLHVFASSSSSSFWVYLWNKMCSFTTVDNPYGTLHNHCYYPDKRSRSNVRLCEMCFGLILHHFAFPDIKKLFLTEANFSYGTTCRSSSHDSFYEFVTPFAFVLLSGVRNVLFHQSEHSLSNPAKSLL